MPGSSKPLRKLMVAIGGSPDKFRAKFVPKWVPTQCSNIVGLAAIYIAASAYLIQSNRFLLTPERFPFPDLICITQQAIITLAAWAFFSGNRDWFPAAEALWNDYGIGAFGGRFAAMGLALSVSSLLMVIAYGECSSAVVSLVQDFNLIMVFILTWCLGIDRFPSIALLVILTVFVGSLLVSYTFSFIRYTPLGIGAQLGSQLLYVSCILTQDIIMKRQQPGVLQFDPLSVLLLATPSNLICLTGMFLCGHFGRNDFEQYHSPIAWHWPWLVMNGLAALVVGVVSMYLIKFTGAVGYLICGTICNMILVMVTTLSLHGGLHALFHTYYGHLQLGGVSLAVFGVVHYTIMQAHLDCFEPDAQVNGFLRAYRRIFLNKEFFHPKQVEYNAEDLQFEDSETEQLVA